MISLKPGTTHGYRFSFHRRPRRVFAAVAVSMSEAKQNAILTEAKVIYAADKQR